MTCSSRRNVLWGRRRAIAALLIAGAAAVTIACGSTGGGGEEVRLARGAGGVGFLPLLVMEKYQLIEKRAAEAGGAGLRVRWVDLGGPSVSNDALLSGAADFIAAGPPAFITLWDRTTASLQVKGVAAMASLPMYLNTRAAHLTRLEDLREGDKIAMTAIKVSIPALVMQMYASERYGRGEAARFDRYTVPMTHPDGVVALLSGAAGVSAHFTSPPFHQRERKDPRVRTIMTTDDVMGGATTFTMLSTTTKYREEHPAAYAAVFRALGDANGRIAADRRAAAELLLAATGESGFTAEDMVEMLNDPQIAFTTTPQNVMKYAVFMHDVGSIRRRPAAWTEMFFPEIHGAPGN